MELKVYKYNFFTERFTTCARSYIVMLINYHMSFGYAIYTIKITFRYNILHYIVGFSFSRERNKSFVRTPNA